MGPDESFVLKSIKGRVDGPQRDFASCSLLDFSAYCHPIGFITKLQQGEDDQLFKFTEVITFWHYQFTGP